MYMYVCIHMSSLSSYPPTPKRQNETHPYLLQVQASGKLSDARQLQSYPQIILSSRSFLKKWIASNGALLCLVVVVLWALPPTYTSCSRPTPPPIPICAEPNIKFVEEIVTKRKAELNEGIRADQKDVLTLMLTASDPQCV